MEILLMLLSMLALIFGLRKESDTKELILGNQELETLKKKKLGLAAKERNKELLEKVSSKPGYFRLKSYGVGKYGRVLGEIFIMDSNENTICINNQLISEGHAYVYDGGKKKVLTEVNNG